MKLAVCRGGLEDPEAMSQWLLANKAFIVESSPDFFLNSDGKTIEAACNLLREKGMWIRSIHAPFGSNCNLSDADTEKRESAIQVHTDLLYKAGLGNVDIVVIHPGVGGFTEQRDMDKANELAYESVSRLVSAADAAGVRLALENMLPRHPGYSIEHIMGIVERIDSAMLGICFDSGHAHVCGNMSEFMRAVAERMINIHMQDNDGTRDMHLQPPYGTTDWQEFVKILDETGYSNPITIETAPWTGSSYEQMQKEVSAVLENPEDISFRCPKCGHAILRDKDGWFCNCNTNP